MRIKNQFLISILTFGIILIIIGATIALTLQQITELNNQGVLADEIQTGATDLNYISNNYFLYQDNSSISLWQTKFSTLSQKLSQLNSTNPQQQRLVDKVSSDMENLNSVFAGVISFLVNAPRNVSVRVLPSFQTQWNRMAVQIQSLAFDSQQLSQAISDQANQANMTNTILTVAFLGLFGMYFITSYLITYRRTLKSISKLQNGIGVIGSGNLDYIIDASKKDEIADISKSVNQMAINLKTVTASKTELEQAQASLRESEQRWATTLASIGDAVIATDTSGKIVFMNGEAEELTGWAMSEALTKPVKTIFNIINEQSRLEVENPIDRVLKEGIVVGLANHTVLIRKDGLEVPIDDSGAPIRDKDGKTTGVVLVFRDIAERKKAEEELLDTAERLNRSQEIAHLGGWELDLVKNKLSWSDEVYRIFGLKPQEFGATYEAFLQAVHPDDREAVDAAYSGSLREGRDTYEIEHRVVRKSTGEIRIVYEKGEHLRDGQGKIIRSIGMVLDITDRKMMEAKLEEYSKHLENLIEERTKALKDSERLAAIGATAGMVGHDIRNPLQAITGDIYLAKTELASIPEGEEKSNIQENLTEIEKNVDYINKIVADLQDYARPLNPRAQETNIKTVFNEILAKNGVPKNIKVTVKVEDKAERIMADPDYLKRIVANLTLNAVQAMPDGGKLTIRAYADKQTDDVLITVKDTGVGIPEEIKPKLFTPMITTKSKGQGFGLAVVKRMTEGLGGTVTFESTEGKGTTFIIRLPSPKELNGK
jgi:PAS domain S-box-containing protein